MISKKAVLASIILLAACFTYLRSYDEPKGLFYDELYYVAVAQKYIKHYLQFEVHPPLGKLLIALGEVVIHPNKGIDIPDDTIKTGRVNGDLPPQFTPSGYRFFPVVFSTLSALVIFLIFCSLSGNSLLAFFFSLMYVFDNALIVNFRGALLDGTLVFFTLLSTLYFLHLYNKASKLSSLNYFLLGCLASLAICTKIVGTILFLLFVFLYFKEPKHDLKKMLNRAAFYSLGLFVIFFSVYYIHIALGSRVLPDNKGSASSDYLTLVSNKGIYNPFKMYVPFKDNMLDMKRSHSNMAKVDMCNPLEIASHPVGWPLGIKSINMLRESNSSTSTVKYLTIQGNPVNWLIGLLSVFLSICLVVSKAIFKTPVKNKKLYNYILIFTALYVGYMAAIIWSGTQRILYMHLYFIPLVFSFVLAFLMFSYLFEKYIIKKDKIILVSLLLFASLILYNYVYFSPFTYYKALTYEQCMDRKWFSFWNTYCEK